MQLNSELGDSRRLGDSLRLGDFRSSYVRNMQVEDKLKLGRPGQALLAELNLLVLFQDLSVKKYFWSEV
jgi:hypothetical protein